VSDAEAAALRWRPKILRLNAGHHRLQRRTDLRLIEACSCTGDSGGHQAVEHAPTA
jgi:hypothetical protein